MEKRNIQIDITTAKEWYKKGGELREVALQAYTEDELKDKKPMSWDEYVSQSYDKDSYFGTVFNHVFKSNFEDRYNEFSEKSETKAFIALGKLIQLRDAWIGSWKPNWKADKSRKYVIRNFSDTVCEQISLNISYILAFPTEEMRDAFLETFSDLIEEAKMFL